MVLFGKSLRRFHTSNQIFTLFKSVKTQSKQKIKNTYNLQRTTFGLETIKTKVLGFLLNLKLN